MFVVCVPEKKRETFLAHMKRMQALEKKLRICGQRTCMVKSGLGEQMSVRMHACIFLHLTYTHEEI